MPRVLAHAAAGDVEQAIDVAEASYFLSRIAAMPADTPTMRTWRRRLFLVLWRNQADPAQYLGLPEDRTVVTGSLVEL